MELNFFLKIFNFYDFLESSVNTVLILQFVLVVFSVQNSGNSWNFTKQSNVQAKCTLALNICCVWSRMTAGQLCRGCCHGVSFVVCLKDKYPLVFKSAVLQKWRLSKCRARMCVLWLMCWQPPKSWDLWDFIAHGCRVPGSASGRRWGNVEKLTSETAGLADDTV